MGNILELEKSGIGNRPSYPGQEMSSQSAFISPTWLSLGLPSFKSWESGENGSTAVGGLFWAKWLSFDDLRV